MVQLMPLPPLAPVKSQMVYLSAAGLPSCCIRKFLYAYELDVSVCVVSCEQASDSLYYGRHRRRCLWSRHLRRSSDHRSLSMVR